MEWINIKKEKPIDRQRVLAYCIAKYQIKDEWDDFEIQVAYIEGGQWYLDSKDLDEVHLITHWMPLPNEPK